MSQNEASHLFILMGMSYGVERVGRSRPYAEPMQKRVVGEGRARPQAESVVGVGRRE